MSHQQRIIKAIQTAFKLLSLGSLLVSYNHAVAQSDLEQIIAIRNTSNDALKALDHELVYSTLTDDVLITTGNGTLLCGKDALRNYVSSFDESTMYWIRTADEIEVNLDRGLAWESGVWQGFDPEQGQESIVAGKYSAMWSKASGKWLIRSQLFVRLD